jgi:hypothetical protein
MSRGNGKRKSGGGARFGMVPHKVFGHAAVTTLSHAAFRVLVLLTMQFSGHDNGALALTANQAAVNGISSRNTFYRALAELEVRGLIEQTYPASRVPPRPTQYALTWIPIHDTTYSTATRLPSHAYRDWRPEPKIRRRQKVRLRSVT